MRIGLVVDSSCDLPHDFIEQHGIVVMPIIVQVDGRAFVDNRDDETTGNFFREHLASRHDAIRPRASFATGALLGEIFRKLVRSGNWPAIIAENARS